MEIETNREFAQNNEAFRAACVDATYTDGKEAKPTKRQASKWRRGFGVVYQSSQEEV